MADQDDFTFDEQDSDSEEWYEEEPQEKKKSGNSRSRILLLLLLLVAIAGGGYYYMMMSPSDDGPSAPTKAVVKIKKKPMAMPSMPKEVKTVKVPEDPVAKADSPDKIPQKTVEPAPAPMKQDVPDKVAEKPTTVPAPAKTQQVFEPADETQPVKVSKQSKGPYTLTAGTYLLPSSVKSVSRKIRALGFEPVTTSVQREVTMTRLSVGTFSKAEAAEKIAELRSIAPGVFGIRKGDQETVYVGSYLVLDKARRFADVLFKKGINLVEEPVQIKKTLQRVTFGSFADADEARNASRQAAAKGVEAQVFKNP